MATKLLVCPECSSAVAPGRFACTSCGALLAAVASAPRSLGWVEDMTPPVVTPPPPAAASSDLEQVDPGPVEPNGRTTIGPAWAHGLLERAPGETDIDLEIDEDAPLAAETGSADESEPLDAELPLAEAEAVAEVEAVAQPGPIEAVASVIEAEPALEVAEPVAEVAEPVAAAEQVAEAAPLANGATDSSFESPDAIVDTQLAGQSAEPSWPETRSWPPPGAERLAPMSEAAQRPRAGAYLPPSAVLTTIDESHEAMTGGVPGSSASAAASQAANGGDATSASAKPRSLQMPAIDPTLPPKVVVIGAGIAGLGFLLPWAAVVIGSGRIGGYLEQWGLAGPGHPIVLLVLVALGAWASQVERLPAWVRPGLPAVVLAGLLVGLVWPYIFASLQSTVGVYLTLIGAIVLAAGGLLNLWAERHAGEPRAV